MRLHGLHHLTAVTADAAGNKAFYTEVLGMRLVKKTVNQDDTSAYHLFYADGAASPGTDVTFFDWPTGAERRGSGTVVQTGLRVAGPDSLDYWAARLDSLGVRHGPLAEAGGRQGFTFQDPEGQRLALVDDGGAGPSHPWDLSPVPPEHQIRGLGPVTISVRDLEPSARFLTEVMAMTEARAFTAPDGTPIHVFTMAGGGLASELHVRAEPGLAPARPGAGGVHHVAFRIPDDAYQGWAERLRSLGVPNSGPVDRFYFRSLYAREPGGILYEIATDGPGFATDEPLDSLGGRLALPPFLEPRRAAIEAGLKPL